MPEELELREFLETPVGLIGIALPLSEVTVVICPSPLDANSGSAEMGATVERVSPRDPLVACRPMSA